jgi:hypothetical protein
VGDSEWLRFFAILNALTFALNITVSCFTIKNMYHPGFGDSRQPEDMHPDFLLIVNIAAQKTVTNKNSVLEQRKGGWSMAERWRFCRKGLLGFRWGRYCTATSAPLHDDNGPVATSGGPYGRTIPDILAPKSGFSAFRNCTDCEKAG